MPGDQSQRDKQTAAIRRFNRFYTRQIGVLDEGFQQSPFSLTEARVLYELAHRDQPTATDLVRDLELDAGYLSRILGAFEKRGLITRQPSERDARQSLLRLTKSGRQTFDALERRTQDEVGAMLDRLSTLSGRRLVEAMRSIEQLLDATRAERAVVIRTHESGDIGWIIGRQGALYTREYGWDLGFEALAAHIAAAFLDNFDAKAERCWIAELDGVPVGSIMLVKKSKTVGQLRLLFVEPEARGYGIGRRLVAECLRFARQVGYRRVVLWTQSNLDAARHLYEEAGFRLIKEEPHHSFGYDLIAQTWELKL
jgi:DNA-binding MarR family transcriptional regulator/N-acetylglutamate synthase-like GNAT family acetyltransferase